MKKLCSLRTICSASALALPLIASAQTFTTIDYPAANQTLPFAAKNGTVVGLYYDEVWASHAFILSPTGTFVSFDGPAGTTAYGPYPIAVNARGETAGYYYDNSSSELSHGFVRLADGTFTSIEFSKASGVGTVIVSLDDRGTTIGGTEVPPLELGDAFSRSFNGKVSHADIPSAQSTAPAAANDAGVTVGSFVDKKGTYHAYVGTPPSKFVTFELPGGAGFYTLPRINNAGDIVSTYSTDSTAATHGYLRLHTSQAMTVDYPGARYTELEGIDDAGNVAGEYADSSGNNHAFIRSPNGAITSADFPGATSTQVYTMSAGGAVLGDYIDVNGVDHGYIRLPPDPK